MHNLNRIVEPVLQVPAEEHWPSATADTSKWSSQIHNQIENLHIEENQGNKL